MTQDERFALIDAGAQARASGFGAVDNPAFRSDHHPHTTGQSRNDWIDRIDAWQLGWEIEDAARQDAVSDDALAGLIRRIGDAGGEQPGR